MDGLQWPEVTEVDALEQKKTKRGWRVSGESITSTQLVGDTAMVRIIEMKWFTLMDDSPLVIPWVREKEKPRVEYRPDSLTTLIFPPFSGSLLEADGRLGLDLT